MLYLGRGVKPRTYLSRSVFAQGAVTGGPGRTRTPGWAPVPVAVPGAPLPPATPDAEPCSGMYRPVRGAEGARRGPWRGMACGRPQGWSSGPKERHQRVVGDVADVALATFGFQRFVVNGTSVLWTHR